jgi:SAM-dependent methyltransferase
MVESKLSKALEQFLGGQPTKEALAARQEDIIRAVSSQDRVDHTGQVYDATAAGYDQNPHTRYIIPELLPFIGMLPDDGLVLDLGAGHGRDTLFMAGDETARKGLLPPELAAAPIPDRRLRVVPYDLSQNLLDIALAKAQPFADRIPAVVRGDFTRPQTHAVRFVPPLQDALAGIFYRHTPAPVFDGLWACASFLIHTPLERVDGALKFWGGTLKQGGIACMSYINPALGTGEQLQLSQTGEVKHFARPTQDAIDAACAAAGLERLSTGISDYVDTGKGVTQPAFFRTEFYRKQ